VLFIKVEARDHLSGQQLVKQINFFLKIFIVIEKFPKQNMTEKSTKINIAIVWYRCVCKFCIL
jgi:hypothetical protein